MKAHGDWLAVMGIELAANQADANYSGTRPAQPGEVSRMKELGDWLAVMRI